VSERGSSPDLAAQTKKALAHRSRAGTQPFQSGTLPRGNPLLEFGARIFRPFERRLWNEERSDWLTSELAWLHSHPAS
jgi:hypothetical protein